MTAELINSWIVRNLGEGKNQLGIQKIFEVKKETAKHARIWMNAKQIHMIANRQQFVTIWMGHTIAGVREDTGGIQR